MEITLILNNKKKTFKIAANQTLSELLRANGFWSIKHGCESGNCGNCTVIVGGDAVYSCVMLAVQADGKSVETFENIETAPTLLPLYETLLDNTEKDCGYCIPGMMMSIKTLLSKTASPKENEIIDSLNGIACRCLNNNKPIKAIIEAIDKIRGNY